MCYARINASLKLCRLVLFLGALAIRFKAMKDKIEEKKQQRTKEREREGERRERVCLTTQKKPKDLKYIRVYISFIAHVR